MRKDKPRETGEDLLSHQHMITAVSVVSLIGRGQIPTAGPVHLCVCSSVRGKTGCGVLTKGTGQKQEGRRSVAAGNST